MNPGIPHHLQTDKPSVGNKWLWASIPLLILVGIVAGSYRYYIHEFNRIRLHELEELAFIGALKRDQIQEWRQEVLSDVQTAASNPFFRRALEKWMREPHDEETGGMVKEWLQVRQRADSYSDVLILNPEGHIVLSAKDQSEPLGPIEEHAVLEAATGRRAMLSELYRTPRGTVLIDAMAPILDSRGQLMAVLVLRINADTLLYPMVNAWFTPSRSGETLLVRKDGEDVLFLNNLRYRDSTALSLRQPLANRELPAVQAVMGETGPFDGKDYRGVEVLAHLESIPGSPWFMVAKVDKSELMKEALYRGYVISFFSGLFILLAAVCVAWVYRYRQYSLYKNLYRLERGQREAEERFRTTLYSIGDAVITTDTAGIVAQMNQVAEKLTGWKESEVSGKPLNDVFHIVNEESREVIENPVEKVLREGKVIGLANHTVLISRGGTERPIADSGAPIRDEDGLVYGVVLVFRDQTEERLSLARLRDSQQRLRIIADHIYDWEYWVTPDNQIEFCSPSSQHVTGYRPDEFASDSELLRRIVHPEDLTIYDQHAAESGRAPDICDTDYRIIARNGDVVWLSHRCIPVYDSAGTFLGRRISNRDITDRKHAERILHESEEKHRNIYEESFDGLFVTSPEGRILEMNPSGVALFGYDTLEEVRNLDLERDVYANPLDWNRILAMVNAQRKAEYEIVVKRKNGEFMTCRCFLTPTRDDNGGVISYRGVISDITEKKRAEESLRESEAKHRQLADVAFEAIAFHDQGVLLEANDQYFEMFGYEPDELLGKQAIEKTLSRESTETVRSRVAAGSTGLYEATGLRKDGTTFPIEIRARQWEMGGRQVRATAIRDISERKALEAQLFQAQKMEAVGTLAGGIAHDFNNILQVVCGYSEILLTDKKQDDARREGLQKILNAGERGAELVKNLMTFSRKVEPKTRPLDINHEVVEFQKLLSRTIPKIISIDLRLGDDVKPIIADPSQIGQILMNLGVNARDAMPDGGTLVISTTKAVLDRQYCAAHPETQPGIYVLLSVSDTGTGMDKATAARIFDPFFTTKERGKGTGLGLSIVYGIVKQHQGHITCYSEPGIGTTFRIYFPFADSERRDESRKEEVPIQGGTETILLVDDEEIVRDIALKMLTEFGYSVITACDGKDAVARYEESKNRISLVILDLIMPEMDGKACLKEILRLAPEAKVLIASGYSDAETLTNIKTLGAKEFVEKPFNTRALLQTVREVLGGA
jgi:PAS domain S-box-containing protein